MSNTDNNKPAGLSRRDFISTSAMAGAGVLLPQGLRAADAEVAGARKRVAHVGTGSRARFYRGAIVGDYAKYAEYVGICDNNPGRLQLFQDAVHDATGVRVPSFDAADFDRMIAETGPDVVVNCIGIVKQIAASADACRSIAINRY